MSIYITAFDKPGDTQHGINAVVWAEVMVLSLGLSKHGASHMVEWDVCNSSKRFTTNAFKLCLVRVTLARCCVLC